MKWSYPDDIRVLFEQLGTPLAYPEHPVWNALPLEMSVWEKKDASVSDALGLWSCLIPNIQQGIFQKPGKLGPMQWPVAITLMRAFVDSARTAEEREELLPLCIDQWISYAPEYIGHPELRELLLQAMQCIPEHLVHEYVEHIQVISTMVTPRSELANIHQLIEQFKENPGVFSWLLGKTRHTHFLEEALLLEAEEVQSISFYSDDWGTTHCFDNYIILSIASAAFNASTDQEDEDVALFYDETMPPYVVHEGMKVMLDALTNDCSERGIFNYLYLQLLAQKMPELHDWKAVASWLDNHAIHQSMALQTQLEVISTLLDEPAHIASHLCHSQLLEAIIEPGFDFQDGQIVNAKMV